MTNSPNPGNEPERNSGNRRRVLIRAGFVVGGVVLVGAVAGGWWAWKFINEQLAPLVAANLSKTLNRPVEVGAVKGVSLTSLTFGASAVPPTATDSDRATIEAVEAKFNPLEILWDRTLRLDVTLVRPKAAVYQDKDGSWINTKINQGGGPPGLVSIELDTLRVKEGSVALAAYGEVKSSTVAEPEAGTEVKPDARSTTQPRTQTDAESATLPKALTASSTVTVQDLNGRVTLRNNNKLFNYDFSGKLDTGGGVRIAGTTNLEKQETALKVNGQNLLASDVNLLVPLPIKLQAGRLDTNLAVLFPSNNQPLQFDGRVGFRNIIARLNGVPQPFNQVNGNLQLQGQRVSFENVQGLYGAIPTQVSGSLNTQKGYNLLARVPAATASQLLKTFNVKESQLPIKLAGKFRAELRVTGAIAQPLVSGLASNTQPVQVDRISFATTQTRFRLTPQALTFDEIRAIPAAGGLIAGRGTVKLGDQGGLVFDLRAQGLPGDAIARAYGANSASFAVGQVDADAQVFGSLNNIQTVVQWQAPQATYPGRGKIAIAGGAIRFQDTALLVAGGIVRGRGEASRGRWQAFLDSSGIRLSQFSPELRGLFSGNFQLAGSLSNLNPAAIQAAGQVRFSQGISLITEPLTASVRWLGDRLQVQQAVARGFRGSGDIFTQLVGAGAPAITNLDLNVDLRGYNIAALPIPIPQQVRVGGQADFAGRITGPLAAINVAGRLGVNNLAVNQLAFEPVLTGDFLYAANRRLNLDVSGQQDRVAVQLNGQNRPVSFYVRQGDAIAQGRGVGDRLLATVQNFPIAALNIAPAAGAGLGRVSGLLSGNVDVNLANFNVVGDVAVVNPALDYISADSFTGRFRYIDGVAVLDEGELRRGGSRYLLSGNFSPGTDPQFQGKITADQGRIEDILAALQVFELSDFSRAGRPPTYASAAAVETIPVGTPNFTLLNQLRRFSEITALRNQEIAQREQNSFLPDLATLKGAFSGDVTLAFSSKTGVAADFNLSGQDWTWSQYTVNQILAEGNFRNGVLTLLPLRFASGQSLLTFSGQLGGAQQSGQLRAENIPVAALRDLFKLPLNAEGNLSANATLAGSVGNPQVVGELMLADGKLNNATVPTARSLFGYSNARLNFDGRFVEEAAATDGQNTFQLAGSIPYRFPFMTVSPDSDQFSLDVDIRNQGLALISLFTDQVAWRGGQGDVRLQARGTLQTTEDGIDLRPTATGTATFQDARFAAKALPEELTNVNGTVLFNNDRIQVTALQGQFSKGQVSAQGTLPILIPLSSSDPDAANPLTVNLNNIALNLQNLYDGGVNGRVLITGAALAPQIGGAILLSDGRVIVPSTDGTAAAPVANAPATGGATGGNANSIVVPPRFRDLRVTLGDRLRVTRDPVLNFLARGDLLINGTQQDPRIDGTIRLRSGQVNLFTTQFNLVRGYPNTVVFSGDRGLDPVLDIRLATSVPEVTRYPTPSNSPFATDEIVDTPQTQDLGEIQTVRVQASVTGPASQIFDNLELTSSPSRGQTEILALIGGGSLVSSVQQGNATAAIASLAGAPLLTGLQNLISDTLGLTDFRLFPTTLFSSKNARGSTLALAAELGLDITNNLSVSVLQILTVPQEPTQFGIRYRLTDNLLLRGSTNFSDDNRAVLEFETRF